MAENEAIAIIREYESLAATIEALKKQQEMAKEKLIAYLDGQDAAQAGNRIIRNTPTVSNRFDTKRFKADFGNDSYAEYTKPVISFRFSIS